MVPKGVWSNLRGYSYTSHSKTESISLANWATARTNYIYPIIFPLFSIIYFHYISSTVHHICPFFNHLLLAHSPWNPISVAWDPCVFGGVWQWFASPRSRGFSLHHLCRWLSGAEFTFAHCGALEIRVHGDQFPKAQKNEWTLEWQIWVLLLFFCGIEGQKQRIRWDLDLSSQKRWIVPGLCIYMRMILQVATRS